MLLKYQENFFYIVLFLSYILYFLAFFQIEYYNPKYQIILENIMKYYVIFFLLIRFNPFSYNSFTSFDRTVVFSSALFLLATTSMNNIITLYKNIISGKIKKIYESSF